MDPTTLVMRDAIDDGRAVLARLAEVGFPILAAAWAKTTEDYNARLYIVTDKPTDPASNERLEVIMALRGMSFAWFETSDVCLIRPDETIGAALLATARHPGVEVGRWYRGGAFGRVLLDGPAYLYDVAPAPQPA